MPLRPVMPSHGSSLLLMTGVLCEKLAEAASAKLLGMNSFVIRLRFMIVVVREKPEFTSKIGGTIKNKDYSLIDIGIASENICLQAEAEGLGSCMLGWFDENSGPEDPWYSEVKESRTDNHNGLLPVARREKKRRKPAEVTVSYNKY